MTEYAQFGPAEPDAPMASFGPAEQPVSKSEAAGRGAYQGATAGFGDEINAAWETLNTEVKRLARGTTGAPLIEKYRQFRAVERNANDAAKQQHPWSYHLSEAAGGIATSLLPFLQTSKAIGAVKTILQGMKVGAAYGAVSGVGSSNADLTSGDVAGTAKDAAIGGVVGGTVGGAAAGAGVVLGPLVKKAMLAVSEKLHAPQAAEAAGLPGVATAISREGQAAKEAAEVAAHAGDQPSLIPSSAGKQQTQAQAHGESSKLEKEYSDMLGEMFGFRPSQKTGSPSQALTELKAGNTPATMNAVQGEARKQADQGKRLLEVINARMAAHPDKLGDADTGAMVEGTLTAARKKITDARTLETKPAYAQAHSEKSPIPVDDTLNTIDQIIADKGGNAWDGPGSAQIRKLRADILAKSKPLSPTKQTIEPNATLDPREVNFRHEVDDSGGKVKSIVSDMEQHGWSGRPMLVVEGEDGRYISLTGNHRLAAARASKTEIPAYVLKRTPETEDAIDFALNTDDWSAIRELEKVDRKAGELMGIEDGLNESSAKTSAPTMTAAEAHAYRQRMSDMVEDVLPGAQSQKSYLADQVAKGINADLDKAASSGRAGAALQRQADAAWAKHTKDLGDITTDTVKRILNVSEDAGDTIPGALRRASPGQIKTVMAIVRKQDPDTAKQLFAQTIQDIMTDAGKPLPGASAGYETGMQSFKPTTIGLALSHPKTEARLMAMAGGDKQLEAGYRQMLVLTRRLGFGPGIKGSTTEPQLEEAARAAGTTIEEMIHHHVKGWSGLLAKQAIEVVKGTLGEPASMAEVLGDPKTLALYNKILTGILAHGAPSKDTGFAIKTLSNVLGQTVVSATSKPESTNGD